MTDAKRHYVKIAANLICGVMVAGILIQKPSVDPVVRILISIPGVELDLKKATSSSGLLSEVALC